MKNLKNTIVFIQALILFNSISLKAFGQNDSKDSLNNQLSQEDLIAVLQTLNIEIHKFNVNFPLTQKCNVVLYQQEYEKRNVIKDKIIWGTPSPYRGMQDGKEVQKALEQIRIVTKSDRRDFTLNINMGDFILQRVIKIDSQYTNPHACKPFKLPSDFTIGSKIPLLLIGSYWNTSSKDGTTGAQRFCTESFLNSDFSDRAFDVMPHYLIIGIKIVEQ